MSAFDVALVWPALVTPAMHLSSTTEVSSSFSGGVHGAMGVATLKRATVMGGVGARVFTAGIEVDEREYRGTVADVELEVIERWGPGWSRNSAGEEGIFWELGLGPHLVLMGGDTFALYVNPALGAHTSFGGYVGKGDVRALLAVRASATFRIDQYYGTVVTPTDTVSWSYSPGRVGLELVAGIGRR